MTQRDDASPFSALAGVLLAAGTLLGQADDRVDFNRDIRPILSDRCFQCHGFDAKARKADLRLDTWEGMTREKDGRRPVVPGEPAKSELVHRVTSGDPRFRMPPPSSGLSLSDREKKLLARWIDEGAPFAKHWAFLPPRKPPVPAAADGAGNEIDRFVRARLAEHGLTPPAEADSETLIRRVSLDLTGLPPAPVEVDAFLADRRPGAYERLVDRLLASPRFGERLALVWLDAARYADTNGFHHDNVRTAWPYRDWVIRAFNDNLPFDRFVVEQLAGDLLEDPTDWQRIATAFCRMHNINDEGGALDDEYRVEAVCDRIETIATTFMGLTFTCARCHDHKYDPFTQEDYYSLYAFFNSVDERGVYRNDFEQARAYPARLGYETPDLAARIAAAGAKVAAAEKELEAAEPAIARERLAEERALRARHDIEWIDAEVVTARAESGSRLRPMPDGSFLLRDRPAEETFTFELSTGATGLRLLRVEALPDPSLPEKGAGVSANGNAVVTHVSAEAVCVRDPERRQSIDFAWAWADHEQPNGDYDVHNLLEPNKLGWALEGHNRKEPRTALLLAREAFGFTGGTRVLVRVRCDSRHKQHVIGRPRVSLARARGSLLPRFPHVMSDWWLAGPFPAKDFDTAYAKAFGPETVRRIAPAKEFGKKRWSHQPKIADGKPFPLKGERSAFYLGRTIRTPVARALDLSLGSDDAIKVFLNGREVLAKKALRGVEPDQDKVRVTLRPGHNMLVVKVVNNTGPAGFYAKVTAKGDAPGRLTPVALLPEERRGAELHERFTRSWGAERSPAFARLTAKVDALQKARKELDKDIVPVVVMKELDKPRETFVLSRGRYDMVDKDRRVTRRPPELFGGELPAGAPEDRLGFARWLVQPDHPLTARVHVNRLWQMLFGTGIVETSENFGHQASWPSHPQLLDWLAAWFVESGWDQKALLKLIVTSATYRQTSVTNPEARAADPRNRLLAWFPRRRLPAEVIRDQALYVAGLLVERVGGPSVRPYQPDGLWREVSIGGSSNTQVFKRDNGDALYRRSLYTFWKRTSPSPQMRAFDAPTREFCIVRRNPTNTPLQALVLWNDVQFVEAARVLAQRTLAAETAPDARLVSMFRRCTGRPPSERQLAVLRAELAGFLARYRHAPNDAAELLMQGEAPLPEQHDAAELAAWTMVASTLLNLDATLVRS